MTPKRIISTALLSLSVLTVGVSEAKANEIGLYSDLQEPQLVNVKFKKFGGRRSFRSRRGFRGSRFRGNRFGRRQFRRSSKFGFKKFGGSDKFKVQKKKDFDKHHEHDFHHDDKFFVR